MFSLAGCEVVINFPLYVFEIAQLSAAVIYLLKALNLVSKVISWLFQPSNSLMKASIHFLLLTDKSF